MIRKLLGYGNKRREECSKKELDTLCRKADRGRLYTLLTGAAIIASPVLGHEFFGFLEHKTEYPAAVVETKEEGINYTPQAQKINRNFVGTAVLTTGLGLLVIASSVGSGIPERYFKK